jgi:hypothetical protein
MFQKQASVTYLFLMLLLSSCGVSERDYTESLKWMSETSGIQIPDSIRNLQVSNDNEWGIIVKFETTDELFEEFVLTNNMTVLKSDLFGEIELDIIQLNDIEEIPLDSVFIKDGSDFLTFSDCKTGNSWALLADKKNKIIWFEVLYPDFGGDMPECDKDTVDNNH